MFLRDRRVGNTIIDVGERADWRRTTDADGAFSYAAATLPLVGGTLEIGEVEHPDYEAELGYSAWQPDAAPVLRMRPAFDTIVDIELIESGSGEPVRFSATGQASWGSDSEPGIIAVGDPNRRIVAAHPDEIGRGHLRFPMRVVLGAKNRVSIEVPGTETIERELEPPAAHGHVYRLREEVHLVATGARTLRGRIRDAETGAPVTMARVGLQNVRVDGSWTYRDVAQTQSRAGGDFTLGYGIEHAWPDFFVDHPEYLDATGSFDGQDTLDVALRRRPWLIVVVRQGGRPAAGVPLLMIPGGDGDRVRASTDAEGRVDFGLVNAERALLFVLPKPMAADDHAIARSAVRLEPGANDEIVLELETPDRVAVFGNVPPAPSGIALRPVFVPLQDGRGWIPSRRRGTAGYEAGDVRRGSYLVMLTPDDEDRDGPFALCGVVEVDGAVCQAIDFVLPTGCVQGRLVGEGMGDGLRVVALPALENRSAASDELFASPELAEYLGARPDAAGGFTIEHVADGPHVLHVRRGAKVLSTRDVEVRGGLAQVADWDPNQRREGQ